MKPIDSGEGGSVRPGDDYTWRRACSSASNCVEVHGNWRKSSRSAGNGNCVEVAELPNEVAVRDSKDPDGGILKFAEAAWRGFIADVRAGRYDGPIGWPPWTW